MRKTILSTLAAFVLLLGATAAPSLAFGFKDGFHKGTAVSAKLVKATVHVAKIPAQLAVDAGKDVCEEVYGLLEAADSILL